MATRGIPQLQKLYIRYCEHGGSSNAVREYLTRPPKTSHLIDFANQNPHVKIIVKPRNGHHPYIQGEYITGQSKQICVKNTTQKRIREVMNMLRDTSGRKIVRLGGNAVRGDVLSVQGVWTPMLDIKDEKFEMKVVE
jgi:large subunit ribosomal protein L43